MLLSYHAADPGAYAVAQRSTLEGSAALGTLIATGSWTGAIGEVGIIDGDTCQSRTKASPNNWSEVMPTEGP